MTAEEKLKESKLLSQFEKYKGYSSNLFDNEEWSEFDAFKAGSLINNIGQRVY